MTDSNSKLSRRRLFAGAGVAGAVAAAAAVLPVVQQQPQTVANPEPSGEKPEGYRVTEHIQRYYQTARV